MEEQWQVDRACLRRLCQEHPTWSQRRLAQATKRSASWVKKWRKRLAAAAPDDREVLKSRSRCPKTTKSRIEAMVIERILAIRDNPPLNRIPGPLTIKYYLHQQEKDDPLGCYLPTSTSTIWRILNEHQRIYRPEPPEPEDPSPLAEPMEIWQIDFKDVTSVRQTQQEVDKRQHFVETLKVVDTGTSILVDNPARCDFNAETVIRSLARVLQTVGCPQQITFERALVLWPVPAAVISRLPLSASWLAWASKPIFVRPNALTETAMSNATTAPTNMKPSSSTNPQALSRSLR